MTEVTPESLHVGSKKDTVYPTQRAYDIVHSVRMEQYGHPYENQVILKKLWEGIFGIEVSFTQINFALMALKMCRELTNPGHMDNVDDIAGYCDILAMVTDEADRRST